MLQSNTNTTLHENELWAQIRNGDKKSLSSLFRLYSPRLFNYGYKIVPCEDFIEDCIQELFLTIWEQRKTVSNVYSVKAYLYVSMRRMVLHNLKKNRNLIKRNIQYAEEFVEEIQDIESWIVIQEIRIETKNQLNEAIKTLSNRQKEIIKLKYDDGLSNSEIAGLLKIKRQSVYNHVSEALKELKYLVNRTPHYPVSIKSPVFA